METKPGSLVSHSVIGSAREKQGERSGQLCMSLVLFSDLRLPSYVVPITVTSRLPAAAGNHVRAAATEQNGNGAKQELHACHSDGAGQMPPVLLFVRSLERIS